MSYGAIDIGTNAVLLLIMEDDGAPREVLDISTITRLGEGLIKSGRLSAPAMERTVEVLARYREICSRHNVARLRCFGTSAVREAANRDELITQVYERAGIQVEVFSDFQEAYYTYLSVKHDPAVSADNVIIVDIGGGSTEIIRGTQDRFIDYVSLPVGTVKLTELFIGHDPPLAEELEGLAAYVRGAIGAGVPQSGGTMVGMAGTMTTLAAMILGIASFDKEKVHAMTISARLLDDWIARLAQMTVAERRTLPGMEAGREDLLLQGMVLMREIMRAYGAHEFIVSTHGARYGAIYETTAVGKA